MYGRLPGCSGGLFGRIAPPPVLEYANRWISPPLGIANGGLNVHPSTFAHHAFVAAGSELAKSVCVIHPYSPLVGVCRCFDSRAGFVDFARVAGFFFFFFGTVQILSAVSRDVRAQPLAEVLECRRIAAPSVDDRRPER